MRKSTASRVHEAPLGTAGMLEGHWLAIPCLVGKYAEKKTVWALISLSCVVNCGAVAKQLIDI